ncbi:MAG: FAS1-like dehydratase domain-containing protein [Promethearchaeia archaeon]
MDKEKVKKNAEFLIENLPGKEVKGKARFRVKYENLVNFAKCFDIEDPKYVGSEEEIVAFPAFANAYFVKAFYKLVPGLRLEQNGRKRMVLLDPGKLLHASQEYEFIRDVKPGDKLTSTATVGDVWEKNLRLFIELKLQSVNQNRDLVTKGTTVATIAPGGY